MDGMSMMLKSFGIDPEKIKAELSATIKGATDAVNLRVTELTTKIDNVQASCERIEQRLDAIMRHENIGIGGAFDNRQTDSVGSQLEERINQAIHGSV